MKNDLIVSSNDAVQMYHILPPNITERAVIDLWLQERPDNTVAAYERDITSFLKFVQKPLRQVTLVDLYAFSDSMIWSAQSSKVRALNAIKSLFTFCYRTGYTPLNVGAGLRLRKVPSKLAGRILTEEQVLTMFALETDVQKHAILRILYYGGLRVSELCQLTWADIVPSGEAGQVNVLGKGDKPRSVPIPSNPFQELLALRDNAPIDSPVFTWHTSNALDRVQVYRIVSTAAIRAGIAVYSSDKGKVCTKVSPHWLRHAHASHALNHGAPMHLVRDTLGHSNVSVTDKYSHARPGASSSTYLPI